MARKPSSQRPTSAQRGKTNSRAGSPRAASRRKDAGGQPAPEPSRSPSPHSSRAKRSDEQVWSPDQQAATRGRAGRRVSPGDSGLDYENLRAGARDGASEQIANRNRIRGGDAGATETSNEHQGMGRGHRRNFDQSDNDAITRGQSRDAEESDQRDSGVNRRSRPMDDSAMTRNRSSSRGGRPGRRSDW